jgi:lysine-N-methylase
MSKAISDAVAAGPLPAQPTYAAAFHCIGPDCEDHCCGEWEIPVDKVTYEKYREFPAEGLGAIVSQLVTITPDAPIEMYAQIHKAPSGCCAFFGEDHLCKIQKQYGPALLSATCSIYPRSLSRVADTLEGALSLSCPEAARNILLDPGFIYETKNLLEGGFRTDNVFRLETSAGESHLKPSEHYLEIRSFILSVLRNRAHPLWKRLLLIGFFCKRMDDIAATKECSVAEVIGNYSVAAENEAFWSSADNVPREPLHKVQFARDLTAERVHFGASTRFLEVSSAFAACVGVLDRPLVKSDLGTFRHTQETYLRPYLEAHPHILENFLTNYIFQNLFPFGKANSGKSTALSMYEEFLRLSAQFAWLQALLNGMAHRHTSSFGDEHVVLATQSMCRTIEHDPQVLKSLHRIMKSRGLDTLNGISLLLRD